MHLRRASPGHLPLLLDLVAEFYELDGHAYDTNRARGALSPLLQDDRFGVVYLIQADHGVDGYAVVTWGWSLENGGRDALLDEIYVRTQGAGLGSQAMQAIVRDLQLRDLPRLFLETEAENERARRFYERHGFSRDDSIWMSRPL